jgi:hypothetical protein
MPLAGFEPAISATERPQAYALDRIAIEIGLLTTVLCLSHVRFYTYCYMCEVPLAQ